MHLRNSFIAVDGVGERTERELWRAGVTRWGAFDGPTVPGVGPTLAERIDAYVSEATARLERGDAGYFAATLPDRERWRLFEDFRDCAAFLDIETTGLSPRRDDVTVVSVHRGGETRTLVRGQDLSRRALDRAVGDARLLVTYNGAQFDVPFLESAFGFRWEHAHLDLRSPAHRLGLTGGLKAIERDVGIDRERPDLSGRDAVRLWQRYARRSDHDALETLVEYNREDTRNLASLADSVVERLHTQVFEPAVHGDPRSEPT